MRALLLHPSLAQDGADQGYLEWLHHGGVVSWRGEERRCFTPYFLLTFPGGLLAVGRGRRDIIIAGVLGPGALGRSTPVLLLCPLWASVLRWAPTRQHRTWETSEATVARPVQSWHQTTSQKSKEDRMLGKISIYIYFTITSLAGDSFIIEIIYRKFGGGKHFTLLL